MTSTDDPALEAIATQTFRLVRKGFDPEEVRTYLVRLDEAVTRLQTADDDALRADDPPAAASEGGRPPATPDEVARAEGELGQLQAEQDALRAWFGEDGRADPAELPREVVDAAARANDLIRDAEAQAAEILAAAEVRAGQPQSTDGGDRWDDLGEHVARILAHAEEEANAIKADAAAATTRDAGVAEADRTAARDHLAQTQLLVMSMLNEAEGDAAAIRERAEPQARDHVAEIMAQARAELDATRGALRDARTRLTEVHTLVGQSLAEAGDDPGFADPADLLARDTGLPSPAGPASPVDDEPDDAAVPATDDHETEHNLDTAPAPAPSPALPGAGEGETSAEELDAPSPEAPSAPSDTASDDSDPEAEESALAHFFDEQDPPELVHPPQPRRGGHGGWRARFTKR